MTTEKLSDTELLQWRLDQEQAARLDAELRAGRAALQLVERALRDHHAAAAARWQTLVAAHGLEPQDQIDTVTGRFARAPKPAAKPEKKTP